MGSEDRAIREKQLAKAQAEFDARKAKLVGMGLDEKALKKDALLRNLRANVKKAKSRITAIDAAAAHVAEMAAKSTKLEKEVAGAKKGKEGGKGGAKGEKGGAKGDKGGAKGDKGGGKKEKQA